jgi:DNA-binding response OmpR family regulator
VVVDDEEALAHLLTEYLTREGFIVTSAADGLTGLTAVKQNRPEIVVLDIGLPAMDGIEVCRQIRSFSDCYILMLTARADEAAILTGLAAGADDYMIKPFSPRELVARTQVLRRRPRHNYPTGSQPLLWGPLRLDPSRREAFCFDQPVSLTRTEFDILTILLQSPNQVFSREQILVHLWGPGWVGDLHVVDVHVGHIRRKLTERGASGEMIQAVRGVGYRLGMLNG